MSDLQRFGRRFVVRGTLIALVALVALVAVIVVSLAASACGDPQPPGGSESNGDPQAAETENGNQGEPASEANGGFTLEVPIGRHLEPTEIEVGLQFWLEASEDPVVGALPGRAEASVGVLYQPSLDSPTAETFWIHVYTDRSRDDAIEWVRHLGLAAALAGADHCAPARTVRSKIPRGAGRRRRFCADRAASWPQRGLLAIGATRLRPERSDCLHEERDRGDARGGGRRRRSVVRRQRGDLAVDRRERDRRGDLESSSRQRARDHDACPNDSLRYLGIADRLVAGVVRK